MAAAHEIAYPRLKSQPLTKKSQ